MPKTIENVSNFEYATSLFNNSIPFCSFPIKTITNNSFDLK